ncbi:MAG: ECF transporter S component [Lachnospiraceae bacterium]|nr:ECF transporter S component [Lachnospiraceae bacterium]
MNNTKTFNMVMTALFIAIIAVMTFIPNVGYINLIVIKATLLHVPVIVGSIVLGPKNGAVLGAAFGITSLIKNTLEPSLLSFAFSPFYSVGEVGGNGWSVVIALVPRILVGVIPYFVYKGIEKLLKDFKKRRLIAIPIAAAVGAFTNTLLVMNLIYFCFREEFAAAQNIALEAVYDVILGIIAANGIPETIVAVVLGTAVSMALLKIMPQAREKQAVRA